VPVTGFRIADPDLVFSDTRRVAPSRRKRADRAGTALTRQLPESEIDPLIGRKVCGAS